MLGKYLVFSIALLLLISACRKSTEPLKMHEYPRLLEWTADTLFYDGSQSRMESIWGSSVKNVYTCGHSSGSLGQLWNYDGENWHDIDLRHISSLTLRIGLDGEIFGFGEDDIWIVGWLYFASSPTVPQFWSDSSLILHYNGTNWKQEGLKRKPHGLLSIWGSSRNEIWAGGVKGSFYRYNGSNWQTYDLNLPPNDDLDEENGYLIRHISGNQSGEVYLDARRILKNLTDGSILYTYKNNTWTIFDSTRFLYKSIHDLWVSPAGNLYVLSDKVYRYNGLSWTEIFDMGGYCLKGTRDDNIFLTSRNHMKEGLLYHYNGKDWYRIKEVGGNMWYWDLWTDGKEVFVVGETGESGGSGRISSVVWHGK